jgi:peroxiredoxin
VHMMIHQRRLPLQPGEVAPNFTLATVPDEGFVSLADYRGRTPVLLAVLRGLYCAFCRRHIVQLGVTRRKLQALGVEVLAIVATKPEQARLYYRFRPVGVALAADPELTTHRAYGVPTRALTPEILQVVASKYIDLARELKIPAADVTEIRSALYLQDGIELPQTDAKERRDWSQYYGAQFAGQFLIDREGIVRWVNIEGDSEGLNGLEKFPTDDEYLAAARASLRGVGGTNG